MIYCKEIELGQLNLYLDNMLFYIMYLNTKSKLIGMDLH